MIRLHSEIKALVGLVVLASLVFVIINWDFLSQNFSFWWQSNVTNSWEEARGDLVEADKIKIASLNIEAPVIYVDEIGEGHFQEALQVGIVHYPGTAKPGEYGNAFYFGHSSDFAYKAGKYKTVFALLPQIGLGETIEITDMQGRKFVYEVFNTLVVSPTQTEVLSQGDRSERLLTLQTSYPIGTAFKRFIAQAKLIN